MHDITTLWLHVYHHRKRQSQQQNYYYQNLTRGHYQRRDEEVNQDKMRTITYLCTTSCVKVHRFRLKFVINVDAMSRVFQLHSTALPVIGRRDKH